MSQPSSSSSVAAAAGIPNLLDTLRSTKSSTKPSRSHAQPHPPSQTPSSSSSSRPSTTPSSITTTSRADLIIQQTDSDAAGSRLSAVLAGYLVDEFAQCMWEASISALGPSHSSSVFSSSSSSSSSFSSISPSFPSHAPTSTFPSHPPTSSFPSQPPPRRMPIINRGTYVRTTALDRRIESFLEKHKEAEVVQVLSLGAGTDTRCFRMLEKWPRLRGGELRYHEVDFGERNARKVRVLEGVLRGKVGGLVGVREGEGEGEDDGSDTPTEETPLDAPKPRKRHTTPQALPSAQNQNQNQTLHTPSYHLHALDLRLLVPSSSQPPDPQTKIPNLLPDAPTLILSECCLTYLSPHTSTALLSHLTTTLLPRPCPIEILLYEPLHPHDAFGRTMLSNLSARGIEMPGLVAFPTLEAHGRRLVGGQGEGEGRVGGKEGAKGGGVDMEGGVGMEGWEGKTVREVWEEEVGREERERLRKCEMVDEEEEWALLAGHYGVVRG